MKKFQCADCGQLLYSAGDITEPCCCGGKFVEQIQAEWEGLTVKYLGETNEQAGI